MSSLVFQIILLLVSLIVQASGAAPRLARDNCTETCGNVTIPFPFGIGTGCFLDDWYEIVCQQNDTVLNKTGLRVLNISLPTTDLYVDGMIKVSLPVIYSNASCQGKGLGKLVNLSGSSFVFSQRWNIFASVGCDTEAKVTSTESAGMVFTSTGCRSKCARTYTNFSGYSACSGMDGCCQTTLPLNLQAFKVDIIDGGQQGCKYAFLAERSWFSRSNVTDHDTVPVMWEWGIRNNTDYYHELIQRSTSTTDFDCHSSDLPYMRWCHCSGGYGGNPYILGGCQGNIYFFFFFLSEGNI